MRPRRAQSSLHRPLRGSMQHVPRPPFSQGHAQLPKAALPVRNLNGGTRSLVVSKAAESSRWQVTARDVQNSRDEARHVLQADAADADTAAAAARTTAIAPSRCPVRCREFGTCNEELGRCAGLRSV